MKKIALYMTLTLSIIFASYATLPVQTSASAFKVTRPMPGTYEIDIYGDASGLYSIFQMFEEFSVSKMKWSASIPTYPNDTISMGLTVRSLDLIGVSDTTRSLSFNGLEEALIDVTGAYLFVSCRSGTLNVVFSDPYYNNYYWTYRKVDIIGTLGGNVVFTIDIPQLAPSFNYMGSELAIDIHIGMD